MRPHFVLGVLFAGLPLLAQTATYVLFTTLSPVTQPGDREGALMAHDPVRGRTLLAGGRPPGGGNVLQETWEWNGTTWQRVFPASQLNWNRRVRLVWASQRNQILAVLGEDVSGGSPMQIHGWTGTNWVLVNGSGPPSRADFFDVAWDSARGVLVMFGHPFGAETWEWNGTTWALRGTGGPVPRGEHRMVYDASRQCVVLYGGVALTNARLNDTWEWNGVYWLERFGIAAPDIYSRGTLGYDSSRQRVVLHGGFTMPGNDTGAVYEYDGAAWLLRTTQGGPVAIQSHAMAFDPASHRFVLFGGHASSVFQRTRTLSFVSGTVASSAHHGAGCAGPVGVPSVTPIGASRPVLGTSFQLRFGSLPNSPFSLVFATIGFQDQTWNSQPLPLDVSSFGLPGCLLRIDAGTTIVLGNTSGTADWNIPLPAGAGLDGQQFFVQGAVLTPGWNAAGAVLSDSRRGTAGIL